MHSELDSLAFAATQLLERIDESLERHAELQELARLEEEKLERLKAELPSLCDRITFVLEGHAVSAEASPDPTEQLRVLRRSLQQLLATHREAASEDRVLAMLRQLAGSTRPSQGVRTDSPSTDLRAAVRQAMASLPEVQALVLGLRFGLDGYPPIAIDGSPLRQQTLIADTLGVSQTTVSRMIDKSIRAMRHPARSDILRLHFQKLDLANRPSPEAQLLIAIFRGPTRGEA